MNQLTLTRYVSTPYGTLGHLLLPNGLILATVEPPWRDNKKHLSCVPAGTYNLHEQPSPLVERITLAKFRAGLFLVDVPNRSRILIHPGNFANESKGCILVGMKHATINGRPGVERSQIAFADLMTADTARPFDSIQIAWNAPHGNIPQI